MKNKNYNLFFHKNDLPPNVEVGNDLSIDCEMLGLNLRRDRLCLLQLFDNESKDLHMVHFVDKDYDCPNLRRVLMGDNKHFIGHMIRLDLNWISYYLGVEIQNVFCTRTASRLARTTGVSHNFEDLVENFVGVVLDKSAQQTNWAAKTLSPEQIEYAANDVIYLKQLKDKISVLAQQEDRQDVLTAAMAMIPLRVKLDVAGWDKEDILSFPF